MCGEQPPKCMQVTANAVAGNGELEVSTLERLIHRVDKRGLLQFGMRRLSGREDWVF